MSEQFDQVINRQGTLSLKYEGLQQTFGRADVQPMWVADMDFAAPDAVTQALKARAEHPIYGYSMAPESLYEALIDWMRLKHNWHIQREWIVLTPGVVPSLSLVVAALTNQDDGVIVQPPVYFPFLSVANNTGRHLIENPLVLTLDSFGHSSYQIDFEHFEACAKQAKILLLCSPHNPVGRVWSQHELQKLLAIAKQHQLIILADEIHADLVYPDAQHHVLATLDLKQDTVITAVAPSKTFNIPGLGLSALIVPHAPYRKAIQAHLTATGVSVTNPFSLVAFEAAYRHGHDWLNALLAYLQVTRDTVMDYANQHLPNITVLPAQGTYLLWLDCRQLGLDDQLLQQLFLEKAKLALSPGAMFGKGGSGFMRMNIGTSRKNVLLALDKLKQALN
ncbi:MAG: MalY/PatB family protein [Candidatus Methylopumilus sp.]